MLKDDQNIDNEVRQQVAGDVNDRLEKAIETLRQKHASGHVDDDNSVSKPSGPEYQKAMALKNKQQSEQQKQKHVFEFVDEVHQKISTSENDFENDDGNGDEDNELRLLREQRLRQIKSQHQEKLENIGKGHGQYREIVQDEFLSEVTNSTRVVVHFYHRDFPRCEIMNHHLARLATRHIETKFIKIDAEKAPFFVSKLLVRTIPTLIYLVDGVAKGKLLGFEGLSTQMPENKQDEWPTILLARILASNDMINREAVVDEDGEEAAMKARMEEMRRNGMAGLMTLGDEDLMDDES